MKTGFKLAIGLALVAIAPAAQAAIITVNFSVAAGSWFGGGTPYGLTNPTLAGSVDVDDTDSTGNSFKSLSFVTGNRIWTLADIDVGSSSVTFNGLGDFERFGLVFADSGNYVYTSNTVSLFDPQDGQLACNGCVSASVGTGAVPEPASWAMLITGFGLTGAVLRRRHRIALA